MMRSARQPLYRRFAKLKHELTGDAIHVGLLREVELRYYYPLRDGDPSILEAPRLEDVLIGKRKATEYDLVSERELAAKQELDREAFVIQHLSLLPKIVDRMAALSRETNGRAGVALEYHQRVPSMSAFAGFAAVRLGEVAIAKYRPRLQEMFNTVYFDEKQQVKFGRRAGKTFMACFIIAAMLVSQPNCSGVFMCLNTRLAGENADRIVKICNDIINDPKLGIKAAILKATMSEGTIRVRSHYGTVNKVTCSPDPRRSNLRGQGHKEGFFFVDESDFYDQAALDIVQPIWSMRILVCMYTSQGYSLSPASKMVAKAILPDGRRVWRNYFIKPGRISLFISEDYARVTREDAEDFIVHGRLNLASNSEPGDKNNSNEARPDPVRSLRRPWYNPVAQTLSFQVYQLRQLEAERPGPRNGPDKKTTTTTATTTTTPLDKKKSDYANYVTKLEALVVEHDYKNADLWTSAECIWLLTLPLQQDPLVMQQLKVSMTPEAFAREMLSDLPELDYELSQTFLPDAVNRLFHPENRFKEVDTYQPIRWVLGFDPGGGGSSDSVLVSALIFNFIPTIPAADQNDWDKHKRYIDNPYVFGAVNSKTPINNAMVQDKHGGSISVARAMEKTRSRSLQQVIVVRKPNPTQPSPLPPPPTHNNQT